MLSLCFSVDRLIDLRICLFVYRIIFCIFEYSMNLMNVLIMNQYSTPSLIRTEVFRLRKNLFRLVN